MKVLVSVKNQILIAALMWMIVGAFLFFRGLINMLQLHEPYKLFWLAGAVIFGVIKAKMVFEKNAKRLSKRILSRKDPSSLWGFLPFKTWLLICSMISLGFMLRHSPLNRSLVWSIYVAIGASLSASSRIFWQNWRSIRQG